MSYNRVVFNDGTNDYYLGYVQWVSIDTTSNVVTRIIPRAKGVKIYSGNDMGGGYNTIEVHCFDKKDSRLLLETALYNLSQSLANKKGTLTIEGQLVLTNCYFQSFSMGKESNKWDWYTITFIKSL